MINQLILTVKGMLLLFVAARAFTFLVAREDARWLNRKPTWIIVGLFGLGMLGHNVWVAYLALMLLPALLARSRGEAAALFGVFAVALPALSIHAYVGGLYILEIHKYIFLGIGITIAFLINRKDPTKVGRRFDIPLFILIYLALGDARGLNISTAIRSVTGPIIYMVLPYYVISRSLVRPEDVRRFMLAFAFAGFVMAFIAFMEVRLHWLMYNSVYSGLHTSSPIQGYMKQRAGAIRAPASFAEATSLGLFLTMAVVATMAVRNAFVSSWRYYAVVAMMVLGMAAANTRGALVGLVIGVLAYDLFRKRYGAFGQKALLLGLGYMILLAAAQVSPRMAAFAGHSAETQGSSQYRMRLLERGIEEIRKHPVLGTPLKDALLRLEDMRQGEGIIDLVNGYVRYGLTLGVGGAVALFMLFVTLCIAMAIARRKLAGSPTALGAAGFVFAVALISMLASFYSGFGGDISTPFYQVAALGGAVWAMRGRTEGSRAVAAAGPLTARALANALARKHQAAAGQVPAVDQA